jgi:tRNA G18 (ribose-2'-O)-methylase SpoU
MIRLFAGLPDRDLKREGVLVAEGRLLAERAAASCRLLGVLADPAAAAEAEALAAGRCPWAVLPAAEVAALAGYPFHRGLLAAAERPAPLALAAGFAPGSRRLAVLPDIADPANLGAIARSAAALGWDGLVLGPGAADPWSRRALRCSMGATLSLPVYAAAPAELADLAAAAWLVAAAELEPDAAAPDALAGAAKLALVFGNERYGVDPVWRELCAQTVAVAQAAPAGVDSLNVAAAAAILLWALRPEAPTR